MRVCNYPGYGKPTFLLHEEYVFRFSKSLIQPRPCHMDLAIYLAPVFGTVLALGFYRGFKGLFSLSLFLYSLKIWNLPVFHFPLSTFIQQTYVPLELWAQQTHHKDTHKRQHTPAASVSQSKNGRNNEGPLREIQCGSVARGSVTYTEGFSTLHWTGLLFFVTRISLLSIPLIGGDHVLWWMWDS